MFLIIEYPQEVGLLKPIAFLVLNGHESCLYALTCRINHACKANARFVWRRSGKNWSLQRMSFQRVKKSQSPTLIPLLLKKSTRARERLSVRVQRLYEGT